MADATIKLGDGTTITVSGSADEIARVVSLYNAPPKQTSTRTAKPLQSAPRKNTRNDEPREEVDLSQIANTINDCEEAELLESHVLDKVDTANLALMCLYINDKYFNSEPALTTGDISKILKQLGISVATSNVSLAISRKAKSYVMHDSVISKGSIVRYSINRRGKKFFEDILGGVQNTRKVPQPSVRAKPKSTKKEAVESTELPTSSSKKSIAYKPKYNAALDLHGLTEFATSYQANNNSEYVIIFVKFISENLRLDSINGDDIYTCFSEIKSQLKLPGSFRDTLRNAQNRDHLISYDRGFTNIELTPKGENLFNHDIVKREKN